MKYTAVLFDLDGTLVDSLKGIADSANEALRQMGFTPHALDAYKYFVGDGIEVLARRALPEERRDEATVTRLVSLIDAAYSTRWESSTTCFRGIPKLLDQLASRNIPMCVLSNKKHDYAVLTVERLLFRWNFSVVAGAVPGEPHKPDPKAALRVATLLDIPPRDIILLGDSDVDMKTAVGSGMCGVGALWGYRTAHELLASGATRILEKPCDLLRLL